MTSRECLCRSTRMTCVECYMLKVNKVFCAFCKTRDNVVKCNICDRKLCIEHIRRCIETGCTEFLCSKCYDDLDPKPGKCLKHRIKDMYYMRIKELKSKKCVTCGIKDYVYICDQCGDFICENCKYDCYANEKCDKCDNPLCKQCCELFDFCSDCERFYRP